MGKERSLLRKEKTDANTRNQRTTSSGRGPEQLGGADLSNRVGFLFGVKTIGKTSQRETQHYEGDETIPREISDSTAKKNLWNKQERDSALSGDLFRSTRWDSCKW